MKLQKHDLRRRVARLLNESSEPWWINLKKSKGPQKIQKLKAKHDEIAGKNPVQKRGLASIDSKGDAKTSDKYFMSFVYRLAIIIELKREGYDYMPMYKKLRADVKASSADDNFSVVMAEIMLHQRQFSTGQAPKSGGSVAQKKSSGGPPFIIKNRMQGNVFREWVNDTHPEYAKKIDLDEEGSHNNAYIKKAWAKHGKEFMKSTHYTHVQVGDEKIPFKKLGTKGYTGEEGRGAIVVKGKKPQTSESRRGKLNRTDVRRMMEELLRTEEPASEMTEFSQSGPGKKVMKEGQKIMSAGKSINELAYRQTGNMRRTLGNISEFVYKVGSALASLNELEEGESVSGRLPTVQELRKLQKEIQRLEKM